MWTRPDNRPGLVLNFSRVERLGSETAALVGNVHRRVTRAGGRLAVCGLRRHLAVVFRITRFDRQVCIYPGELKTLLAF